MFDTSYSTGGSLIAGEPMRDEQNSLQHPADIRPANDLFAAAERCIAGAGLDVFAKEPPQPQGSPLLKLDNVILTPHAIGMDEAAERLMAERCVSNILALHSGRDPGSDFVLNPQVLVARGATHV